MARLRTFRNTKNSVVVAFTVFGVALRIETSRVAWRLTVVRVQVAWRTLAFDDMERLGNRAAPSEQKADREVNDDCDK